MGGVDGLLATSYEGLRDFAVFGYRNSWWMSWNLFLAWIPVALGVALFRRDRSRSLTWWCGLGVFVLFLPNAPYVVSDLVHLRWAIGGADSDQEVLTAVLPVFGLFIAAGYLAYYLCLRMVDSYLERSGVPGGLRWGVTVAVHAVCAVGVVVGRFARLNSWEPVTEPRGTIEQIVVTLTWERAPVALLLTFAAIWLCSTLTKAVVEGVVVPTARALLQRLPPPGPAPFPAG